MSLGVQQNLNATKYMREDLGTDGNVFNAAPPVTSALQMSLFRSVTTPNRPSLMFLDRLGLWQKRLGTGSGDFGWGRIDPLLVDNTSSAVKRISTLTFQGQAQSAFNPSDPSSQRLFGFNSINDDVWTEFDYVVDPTNPFTDPPFPNVGPGGPSAASGIGITDPGAYTLSDNRSSNWVIFPGWKNGDPSNVLGTALVAGATVRDALAVSNVHVPALVNLDTGFATALEGFPSTFQTSPANKFQSGPLFDQPITFFESLQFLADPDSTAAQPKGQIFMSAHISSEPEHFAMWREWNPENVASQSFPRTHLFTRVVTRFDVVITGDTLTVPDVDSNILAGIPPTTTIELNRLIVNPLNGRPTLLSGVNIPSVGVYTGDPYINGILEATPVPVFDQYSNPRARQQVTTNRVVVIGSDALGDLGEKIEGRDVEWELESISTQNETVDTTLLSPGDPAVALANIPVDRNNNFPFELTKGGVPMLETTEFTFVESTGIITFVSPEPTETDDFTYKMSYGHPASPDAGTTFGTLLSNFGVTDSRGEVVTRVQYPDDDSLAGFSDQITIKDPT